MPTNLNALIRYKTINSCLYAGKRKWTLHELIDKCSEALAEYRGRYEPVSERTLRDDIRVMRSEILGFSAPIRQKGGLYFYDDPHYSIMSISFTDSGLILKVIKLLNDIRNEVNHPELEIILNKLNAISGREHLYEAFEESIDYNAGISVTKKSGRKKLSDTWLKSTILTSEPTDHFEDLITPELSEKSAVLNYTAQEWFPCWGDVLGIFSLKSKGL